jgi:hypothetical protein
MSEKDAKQLILASLLVSGLVASGKEIMRNKMPSGRIFIGILVAGFMLSVLAEFAPELAGPLAVLLLITATFASGNLLNQIEKIGKR